jgi:hypothetical protein
MQQGSQPSAISLELGVVNGEVVQAIRTSDSNTARMIKFRLRNDFEGAKLTNLPDNAFAQQDAKELHSADVILKNDLYSIKRWRELLTEADPVSGLFSALATNQYSRFFGHFALSLSPVDSKQLERQRRCFEKLQSPFFRNRRRASSWFEKGSRSQSLLARIATWPFGLLAPSLKFEEPSMNVASSRHHERETDVQSGSNKLSGSCFYSRMKVSIYGTQDEPELAQSLIQQVYSPLAQFNSPRNGQFKLSRKPTSLKRRFFLLDCSEVASIYHPPVHTTERQSSSRMRQLEPPINLPLAKDHDDLFLLGKTAYHDQQHVFGLHDQDASLHGFVVGSSGSGKTTLLKTAIASLIKRGVGFTLVDFHGDFAREVRAMIPRNQKHNLVDFDATDEDPIAFNPLACSDKNRWPVIADSVLAAMKNLFGNSWGPRLEQILLNALSACIAAGDTTLMDVRRMLEQEPLRTKILSRVDDPIVREFWLTTFAGWSKSYRQEAIQSVINKLDGLLSPKLRAMLCQTKPSFNFRQAFDTGNFIVVNLARGEVGQTAASALGSLVLSSIQNAALSRANFAEKERLLHYVFLDEVQIYANPHALTSLLSEARKFRIAVWSATQTFSSVDQDILPIIIGNSANLVSFKINHQDATIVASILCNQVMPSELEALPRFYSFCRLICDSEVQKTFSLKTIRKS